MSAWAVTSALTFTGVGGLWSGHACAQSAVPAPQPSSAPTPFVLADYLNLRLDRMYSLRWKDLQQGAAVVGEAAREAGLTGPVVETPNVLSPMDRREAPAQGLTLLDAWKLASTNDAQLRAARAAQAAGRERLPQARAQMLPSISFSASRFDNEVDRTGVNSLNQPLNTIDRYASQNQTLQLRQPLLRAQLVAQLAQAGYVVDEVDATLRREQQAMVSRLSASYFEALLARDQVELVLGQQRFLQAVLESETRALKAGTGTRTAIDEAQARLDLNRAQELEARQAEVFARRQLQAYLQQPVGSLARLASGGLDAQRLAPGTLEEWTQRALKDSPEIQALQAQAEAARLEVTKTKAAHLPTLDLVAQAQRSRSENVISPQSQYESRGIGLQLNVPLYGGGFVNSATRQAAAEYERAREQMEALREDLSVRVYREYRSITEGAARVRGLEVAAKSAEVALESAKRSQLAGLRTSVDVLNAEQQRAQVTRDLAQARYQTLLASVRLQSLAGAASETLVATVSALLQP